MKISELIEELEGTNSYKKFKTENTSAFFSAGFFVLDLKSESEKIQLDFFLPEQNKVVAFEYPFAEPKIFDEEIKQMQPQTTTIKVDIDDVAKLSKKFIEENNSRLIPTKIIAIFQENNWNLTCMNDGLGIVRIKINAITGEKISFSEGNLMGMMQTKK